jgi:histidinol phosphatase-like PHP family hydrolase
VLTNIDLAELLAIQAETARPPADRALRRASRRAFLWSEEASQLLEDGRSVTELSGVGPYIKKLIQSWIENPPLIPDRPEIRKDFLSLTDARCILARNPSWLAGIKGDLQMHSEWSDGSSSIAELAEAAGARGYEYIAITDHSQGLKIAGGITPRELAKQRIEIDKLNNSLKKSRKAIRVLRSLEMNLNPQGKGDMDSDSLRHLDLVLGCFHSSLRKKEDQTERYLAALRNPAIQILGHPRGRIYNFRTGLRANFSRVFDVAAELDKAVEIDAYPDRQDLNLALIRLAAKAGCRVSLGTDSHGPSQLQFMEFGAAAALLGGLKKDRILNFMSRDQLLAWAHGLREPRSPRK